MQRGEQVEGPPGDRLVGVDLGEVAAGFFGGGFHESAVPALADADADVMGRLGQQQLGSFLCYGITGAKEPQGLGQRFDQGIVTALAHGGNAAANVDQVGFRPLFRQHLVDFREGVGQIKGPDQMSVLQEFHRGLDVIGARRLRLGGMKAHARPRRRHQELVIGIDVGEEVANDLHLGPAQQRIAVAGRFEQEHPEAISALGFRIADLQRGPIADHEVFRAVVNGREEAGGFVLLVFLR